MSLQESVNEFVERNVGQLRYTRTGTVVSDPVYGSFELFPWEAALCTAPIMQRLKRIHQMGLAFHVYPGAVHRRFDHSLGTAFLAGEVLRVFGEKFPGIISHSMLIEIRLAALLHDMGHSPFSRVGEGLWHLSTEFQELETNDRFVGSKPHDPSWE